MYLNFSIGGSIDIVALYAAILSTAIAIWEWIKWQSRHTVSLSCHPNMEFYPSDNEQAYVIATVVNKGVTQIIVTHFFLYFWKNRIDYVLKRNKRIMHINGTIPGTFYGTVPSPLQPGEIWRGQCIQNTELERMAREGFLYMGICHSMSSKEILKRVRINSEPLSTD